ncbi:Golgi pH regulator B [Podila epicladia]|nr:Golgi pH regulator B [Podila epicladia]
MIRLHRSIISDSLGTLEFNFYHRWFDVIFLISGLLSMLFLYFVHSASGSSNVSKDSVYEDMMESDHSESYYGTLAHSQSAMQSDNRTTSTRRKSLINDRGATRVLQALAGSTKMIPECRDTAKAVIWLDKALHSTVRLGQMTTILVTRVDANKRAMFDKKYT